MRSELRGLRTTSSEARICSLPKQELNPYVITDKQTGKCSNDHHPCKRPYHTFLFNITINTARDGHNIVDKVGRGDCRGGEVQDAHIEGKQKKGTRYPAHGAEEGEDKCKQRRQKYICLNTGDREQNFKDIQLFFLPFRN